MNRPVITLTTDFGTRDSYVGAMKGVILSRCPQASIVDISHEIEPQAVLQGAYVLYTATRHFPTDSIHVAVVDPGVGSDRKPIAVSTPSGTFVAPDNGLISLAIRKHVEMLDTSHSDAGEATDAQQVLMQARLSKECRGVVLDDPSFWLPDVSRTFHGRDIFAPVAAHLATGVPISEVGSPKEKLLVFPIPRPGEDEAAGGTVLHIDRYGNLITDIPADAVPDEPTFDVAGRRIVGLSRSYSEAVGELLAVIGSEMTVEIALGNGNAAQMLGASVGDRVVIL